MPYKENLPQRLKGWAMSVSIILENADNATINAIKSVIKLKPQVKFKIKREKSPSDELAAAIKQAQNGETTQWGSLDDFKKAMGV